tara:strand:+ start:545 stop:772 length:228 start_codon:yes stop_codon:yes gene_type:complete
MFAISKAILSLDSSKKDKFVIHWKVEAANIDAETTVIEWTGTDPISKADIKAEIQSNFSSEYETEQADALTRVKE